MYEGLKECDFGRRRLDHLADRSSIPHRQHRSHGAAPRADGRGCRYRGQVPAPDRHRVDRPVNPYVGIDRALLQSALLGHAFRSAGVAAAAGGGSAEQIGASSELGLPALEMYTAGSWGKPSASLGAAYTDIRDPFVETDIAWGRGIYNQGRLYEDFVASTVPAVNRLPKNFKTFDFYDAETGTATSVKTLTR